MRLALLLLGEFGLSNPGLCSKCLYLLSYLARRRENLTLALEYLRVGCNMTLQSPCGPHLAVSHSSLPVSRVVAEQIDSVQILDSAPPCGVSFDLLCA